jgi:hypothetical protein
MFGQVTYSIPPNTGQTIASRAILTTYEFIQTETVTEKFPANSQVLWRSGSQIICSTGIWFVWKDAGECRTQTFSTFGMTHRM